MQASVFAFMNTCSLLGVSADIIIRLRVLLTIMVICFCLAVAFYSNTSSLSL